MDAFARAIEIGVDAIELDIRTTSDRVSVVLHDATTLRLWGRPMRVADQTLAGLRELGVGPVAIPTLSEVVDLVAAAERRPVVLVDTVDADDAAVAWTTLRAHPKVTDGTVSIEWCGDARAMGRIRELDVDAVVCHNHLGGPLDVALIERLRPRTVNVEWTLLNSALVEEVHRLGCDCATWTVDSAEQMSWLVDIGVDAITTNRPRVLSKLLDGGISPLAQTWTDAHELAARCGLGLEAAQWVTVARQVAEWTIHHTRTAALGTIDTKAHAADVVTAVDVAVEQRVREMITAAFPDHLVVGEEMGGDSEPGRPTWYLDPVDGTTNLANHLPWTSMSLALAIDDEPFVAVVAQPWTQEIFLAVRGLGAVRNGEPLQLSRVPSLEGRAVMTEYAAHRPWQGMDAFLAALADHHVTPRVMGSGTLTLTLVADGGSIAGVVHRFHPIDHLAGALIASEAGARVVNSDGGDSLFPSTGGMMVAAPGAAEKLWPLWEAALTSPAAG